MAWDCGVKANVILVLPQSGLCIVAYWISFIPMHLALIVLKIWLWQELGGDNKGVTTQNAHGLSCGSLGLSGSTSGIQGVLPKDIRTMKTKMVTFKYNIPWTSLEFC